MDTDGGDEDEDEDEWGKRTFYNSVIRDHY
jgi:hypothetical protein